MKKLTALLLSVCAAVCVLAFAACGDSGSENELGDTTVETTETSVIFTVDKNFYTSLSDTTSLYDYLVALQDAGKLTFTGSTDSWGFAISSINGKAPVYETSSGYYWAQYTSLTTYNGVTYSSDYSTHDYNGKTLYSNSYYCDGMPAVDGETYAFIYEYTSW